MLLQYRNNKTMTTGLIFFNNRGNVFRSTLLDFPVTLATMKLRYIFGPSQLTRGVVQFWRTIIIGHYYIDPRQTKGENDEPLTLVKSSLCCF